MSAASKTSDALHTYDNIKKTIHRAFDHACGLLFRLGVSVSLKRAKKNTLHEASSFVWVGFEKNLKLPTTKKIRIVRLMTNRATILIPMSICHPNRAKRVRPETKLKSYLLFPEAVNRSFMEWESSTPFLLHISILIFLLRSMKRKNIFINRLPVGS